MHLSLQTFGGSGSNKCQISNYKPNKNLRYVVPAEHHSLEEEFHDEALLLMFSIFQLGHISYSSLSLFWQWLRWVLRPGFGVPKPVKAYNSHSFLNVMWDTD